MRTNDIIEQITEKQGSGYDDDSTMNSPEDSRLSTSFIDDTNKSTEKLYERLEQHIKLKTISLQNSAAKYTLKQKLEAICHCQRQSLTINVLHYWKMLYKEDKDMYRLSQIVLAVPASQVSVERCFSALPIILTKLRSNLTKKCLNCILIAKLNSDLFDLINF